MIVWWTLQMIVVIVVLKTLLLSIRVHQTHHHNYVKWLGRYGIHSQYVSACSQIYNKVKNQTHVYHTLVLLMKLGSEIQYVIVSRTDQGVLILRDVTPSTNHH